MGSVGWFEGRLSLGRSVKVSGNVEEKELAELRGTGLLYDDDEEEHVELGMGHIVRDSPAYTVRHVVEKGMKQKGVPDRRGSKFPVDEQERDKAGSEMGDEMDMIFAPESEFENWAEFAEINGFDVVMVDDLVSNADSWVEVDG
jgi:hypothetical protein